MQGAAFHVGPLEDLGSVELGYGHTGFTAVHRAIIKGDRDALIELLQDGADVEALTSWGWNPLHLAVKLGCAGLLPLLIRPSTLDQGTPDGYTPLKMAVECDQLEAAAVLIASGASLTPVDGPPELLHMACNGDRSRRPELPLLVLNALLADHSNGVALAQAVRYKGDFMEDTALHWAALLGCQQLVVKLLEAGADRDAVDRHGETPLHCAAENGHAHLVPLLVTPTNINSVSPMHGTPLRCAAADGQWQAVAALLAAGARVSARGKADVDVLFWAAEDGSTQSVELLLAALAKECGQQQAQQQQQEGQACLTQLVAAAVVPLAKRKEAVMHCAQLLDMVLSVLGRGVAAGVCHAVEQQLEEEWEQAAVSPTGVAAQASHLAEALLLSWAGSEVCLHAAWQPVLARLQRLVLAVGGDQQGQISQARNPPCSSREGHGHEQEGLDGQPAAWIQQTDLTSTVRQAEEAGRPLPVIEALHPQQQPQLNVPGPLHEQQAFPATSVSQAVAGYTFTPSQVMHQGPAEATQAELGQEAQGGAPSLQCVCWYTCLDDPAAYTTFLAAWVEARRQLQQLPQEMASAVVAAVRAAQQQQHGTVRTGRALPAAHHAETV